jgi:dolichol-phosphate mannosyltransferase
MGTIINSRKLAVVPAYNEAACVGAVVRKVHSHAPEYDVVVVDDGSPDGTGDVAEEMARNDPRVRLVRRGRKAGLAGAYGVGFRLALEGEYDLVVEMDADLSHRPDQLPRLLAGARRHDVTVGSRYVPGGSVTNWGAMRRLLSRGGNRYARVVLGIPVADSTSGFRVFRSDVLRYLLGRGVRSEGYGFQIETVYRAWQAGFDVGEVPITFRERQHGQSKISRRIILEALVLVAGWGIRDRLRPASAVPAAPAETDHTGVPARASGPPHRASRARDDTPTSEPPVAPTRR